MIKFRILLLSKRLIKKLNGDRISAFIIEVWEVMRVLKNSEEQNNNTIISHAWVW
jgi:hypothetical protein